jgi:hypothetical protein
MKIKFAKDGLYYKFKDLPQLFVKYEIEYSLLIEKEDIIIINFKTIQDYDKAFSEICIIPIKHEKIEQ